MLNGLFVLFKVTHAEGIVEDCRKRENIFWGYWILDFWILDCELWIFDIGYVEISGNLNSLKTNVQRMNPLLN